MSGSPTFENVTTLPGIALEDGLAIVRNNRGLYFQLLARFRDMNSGFHQNFSGAINHGDYRAALNLAHNLKGVSANLGINQLSILASNLEQECRKESVEIENAVNAVVSEIELVMHGLEWLPDS